MALRDFQFLRLGGTEIRKFEISCERPHESILRNRLMDRHKRRTKRSGTQSAERDKIEVHHVDPDPSCYY